MLRPKPPWLQALFPWEHKALRVNGRTMAYLDEGPSRGPTRAPVARQPDLGVAIS